MARQSILPEHEVVKSRTVSPLRDIDKALLDQFVPCHRRGLGRHARVSDHRREPADYVSSPH